MSVESRLAEAGFDLVGSLDVAGYDACVPPEWRAPAGCRSVRVVANAGPALWRAFVASGVKGRDPLDRFVERSLERAVPGAFATGRERRAGRPLPLVELAERAGLGRPGRLGLLLHPVYGPWISLRAVVYSDEPGRSAPPLDFDPCTGCPAPCVATCRGGAVDHGLDGARCLRTKLLDRGCRVACDARAACPIGREHAFPPEAVAHHSRLQLRPALALRALRALVP